MNSRAAVLLTLAMLASSSVGAAVYKCAGADGKVEFRDSPCTTGVPGKAVDVRPNVVGEMNDAQLKAKVAEVDARIRKRIAADDADRTARHLEVDAQRQKCQGFVDDMDRQMAWQYSYSLAVRQSAATEWGIARRKYYAERCDRY